MGNSDLQPNYNKEMKIRLRNKYFVLIDTKMIVDVLFMYVLS
jgi:hypothetical protein